MFYDQKKPFLHKKALHTIYIFQISAYLIQIIGLTPILSPSM